MDVFYVGLDLGGVKLLDFVYNWMEEVIGFVNKLDVGVRERA